MMLRQHSVNSDWLINTQSRVLQSDWFIFEINEQATLNINMPYFDSTTNENISVIFACTISR